MRITEHVGARSFFALLERGQRAREVEVEGEEVKRSSAQAASLVTKTGVEGRTSDGVQSALVGQFKRVVGGELFKQRQVTTGKFRIDASSRGK